MNYDDFQSDFMKENKKLKILLVLILLTSTGICASSFFEKRYFLYKGGPIFEERPLIEEVCRLSFTTLTEGTPNPHVIEKGILDIVEKEPFILPIDKLLMVKSLEKDACKVVLTSNGKLMAFKIGMNGNNDHPFYYKLTTLDEIPVKAEEL